jgi:lipopolysaccharide transport system permease protein
MSAIPEVADPHRSTSQLTDDLNYISITANRTPLSAELREFWRYRELLYFLVWRDVKVRYKQTLLGAAWAVLQPLLTMVVFSLFFGKLAGVSSEGLPYPLFTLAALVPWTLFASGLTQASNSLVASQDLLKKIYFPRMFVPLASLLSCVIDFAGASIFLVAMAYWYGVTLKAQLACIAPLTLLTLVATSGAGLMFAALNVRYRDIQHVVPYLVQIWLFASPVAYSGHMLPRKWQFVYAINPMVGVVEGFRWAILGSPIALSTTCISTLAALLMLTIGIAYFRREESKFADIV